MSRMKWDRTPTPDWPSDLTDQPKKRPHYATCSVCKKTFLEPSFKTRFCSKRCRVNSTRLPRGVIARRPLARGKSTLTPH